MNCYICGKKCEGPEGVIHPVGGFGFRHLHCDPQEHVQQLSKETKVGDADGGWENCLYETDPKTGDVKLTTYGQLITARNAAAVAQARAAASKSGGDE